MYRHWKMPPFRLVQTWSRLSYWKHGILSKLCCIVWLFAMRAMIIPPLTCALNWYKNAVGTTTPPPKTNRFCTWCPRPPGCIRSTDGSGTGTCNSLVLRAHRKKGAILVTRALPRLGGNCIAFNNVATNTGRCCYNPFVLRNISKESGNCRV